MQVFYLLSNFYGIISAPVFVASGCASCHVHCYVWHTHFEAVAMPPVAISISIVIAWQYKLQIIQDGYNLLSTKVPCAHFIDIPALVYTAVANRSSVLLSSSPSLSFAIHANCEFQIVLCLTWHGRQTL